MANYLIRRLMFGVVVLWIVLTFVFVAVRVLPGDYATQQVATRYMSGLALGQSQDDALEEARARLGLDEPLPVQYVNFIADLARGDMGESFRTRESTWHDLGRALPYTAQLGAMSLVITLLIGVPVGIVSALYQDRWADNLLRIVAIIGLAAPSFWVATIGIFVVLRYDLFPIEIVRHPGIWEDPVASLQLFIVPALAGGFAGGAVLMRLMRTQMLDVIRQDYVRTARSKGLGERTVIMRHAVKNALIPIVTIFGFLATAIVSGNVILETMFGIPGMGSEMVIAITARDVPVIQTMVIFISTVVLFIHLAVDLSYPLIDPRVKLN